MRKILVSACLVGELCKYNALDNTCYDERFQKWKEEGRLIPICPEVIGGLSVPRESSERQFDKSPAIKNNLIQGRVVTTSGKDVTQSYIDGALSAVHTAEENDVICCIFKHRSPSCGTTHIYDGTFGGHLILGQGVATELLRKAGYLVFNELELDKVALLLNHS